jgi:hypothetical protein
LTGLATFDCENNYFQSLRISVGTYDDSTYQVAIGLNNNGVVTYLLESEPTSSSCLSFEFFRGVPIAACGTVSMSIYCVEPGSGSTCKMSFNSFESRFPTTSPEPTTATVAPEPTPFPENNGDSSGVLHTPPQMQSSGSHSDHNPFTDAPLPVVIGLSVGVVAAIALVVAGIFIVIRRRLRIRRYSQTLELSTQQPAV